MENNQNNKSLCSYPWKGATIRPNGQLVPCCRFSYFFNQEEKVTIEHNDPRNSDFWNNLRNDMLLGKKITGCNRCYNDEESGMESMRQESLKYFIPEDNKVKSLLHLEIAFNNLCNLACAGCSSYFSSKWYNEDFKKGKIEKIGIIENNFSFNLWDLKDLKHLKIIGGEPLMSQNKFIDLLSLTNPDNLNVLIITNGTLIPNNKLKELLLKNKHLSINISLDGIESINDWFRWPSKFDQIVKNMKIYNNWMNDNPNLSLKVHCVINSINVMYLEEFLKFMRNNFPKWGISWDWLVEPEQLSVSIFPDRFKKELIDNLQLSNKNYYYDEYDQKLRPNPFKITIDRINDQNHKSWDDFKKYVLELSDDRNLDFYTMVNRLTPFMNNK